LLLCHPATGLNAWPKKAFDLILVTSGARSHGC
jgi:hypothetical protein